MRNVAVLVLALGLLMPVCGARAEEPAVAAPAAPAAVAEPAAPAVAPDPPSEPVVAAEPVPAPVPAVDPAPPGPTPAPPAVTPPPVPSLADLPLAIWIEGGLLLLGAVIAGLIGLLTLLALRRYDEVRRRRAIVATLSIELETRREAFLLVPAPPNAEAGVSFVAAVLALAEFDAGWRAAQADLGLLPPALASGLARHYGAIHYIASFVKGQSIASALRMLQANRMGGHPCPDAGAMRDCHVELTAAFAEVADLQTDLRALR